MKIARKRFVSPDTRPMKVEEDVRSFWTGKRTGERRTIEYQGRVGWDTILEEVQEFVNSLNPDNVVNICEESHWVEGSYWQKTVIIWYWQ